MTITSAHNPRVKAAARLRDRGERERRRQFLIDGARELHCALTASVVVVEAFVCESLARGEVAIGAVQELERRQVPVVFVAENVFAKLAYGERADGVVVVAATPSTSLADLILPVDPLVAVVEAVEKPGNLGAVLRCADGAGVSALAVAAPRTDLFNPNVVRASMGTLFTVPAAVADSQSVKAWLRSRGCRILAARVDGSVPYCKASFRGPCAIVLGSEAEGLSDVWRDADVEGIRLPMLGRADSLNVAATAAVLFYEALRQRTS